MRHLYTFVLLGLIAIVTLLSFKVYRLEDERRRLKEDLIELSNVKYGIFSVDEWRSILADIITKKVNELNFTAENRSAMRTKVSTLLYKVIDDFEAQFKKENSKSIKGFFQGLVADFTGGFGRIRSRVPVFTEQIINFINDPQNKKAIRGYILDKLNQYADDTFAKIDYTRHDQILAEHNYSTKDAAIEDLNTRIENLSAESRPYKLVVLLLAIFMIATLFMKRAFSKIDFALLVFTSIILLLTGLMLPMIEIDARISVMKFTLLGETVTFTDQVLYYKSKSILEVVWLMLKQSRWDVLIVGILVFVFSVLFPLMKQFASMLFVFYERSRQNRAIKFLVFKTGKWSMADVMVVAIFMSYIGFSGIITEQLKQIENIATSVEILTTNNSSLLTGFFFFTAFAIFSLAISQKIESQLVK